MKMTADCPSCGKKIVINGENYKGWLFCSACQCIFISRDSLRKNWPSLYEALERKGMASGGASIH